MPELKPLPCPAWACQGVLIECKQDGESFFILCKECGMRGPVESDPYHAQQSWDWIPLALTWTTAPPKVAGWYWWRDVSHKGEATIQYMSQSQVERLKTYPGEEWAGPIPTPHEPEES